MSSYLSSILTTTTSRYNSIRRTLLSDETDGDNEDDTHISRVLRAYYIEKGRPFPPWLPADPRTPQRPSPTQFTSTAGRPTPSAGGRGGGSILSDLWDNSQQGGPPPQDQLTLRRGGPVRIGSTMTTANRQGSDGGIVDSYASRMGQQQQQQQQQQQSYLASRSGSYQSSASGPTLSAPASAPSGISAQERLKARLMGSGRASSPSQTPPLSTSNTPQVESQNPYDRMNRYGSSGSQASQGVRGDGRGYSNPQAYPAYGGGGSGSAPSSRRYDDQLEDDGRSATGRPDYRGGPAGARNSGNRGYF